MSLSSVSICVATYRRPAGIATLLRHLESLAFQDIPIPRIQIVVVDNDPAESAQACIRDHARQSRWQVHYVVEARPGISHARNASLAAAATDAEFAAFIDDDEYPDPGWLEALLVVQARYQASVVVGPVFPQFVEPPPSWAVKGQFYEWGRHPTGTEMPYARTNNALVVRHALRQFDPVFDPRFGLTGGEDHHLFMRLKRQGARIVWADEAVVHETIPPDRVRLGWLLRRSHRMYSSHVICEREWEPWYRVYPRRIMTGLGRIGMGTAGLIPSLLLPRQVTIQMLVQIARGTGLLAGLAGWHYAEYRNRREPSPALNPATIDITTATPTTSAGTRDA